MPACGGRIDEIHARIRACRICADTPTGAPLPHPPNPVVAPSAVARIVVCGQAPGNKVNVSGIPFSDPSGDRLRDWMGIEPATFYDTEEIAIVPMGFCFPGYDNKGGDLPPRPECAASWHEQIFAAMPQIELKLLVGQYAQAWHLGSRRRRTLTETVRNWREYFAPDERGVRALPLPHPSWRNTGWIKKNPWFEAQLLPELKEAVSELLADRLA